ncbi:hypothetical protein [Streptomyces sp. NPDC059009]|uniref:hypothetical protein n=1 Tax=Streptomyces sp. NPDC059009 TaxID=3346694 RepID=UPI0036866AF0
MSALIRRTAMPVAAGLLLLLPGQALADDTLPGGGTQNPPGHHEKGSATDDGKLSAEAGAVVYDRPKNGSGGKVGAVTPTGNWTPPPCWYAPKYTPAQLQKEREPIWEAESTGYQWDAQQRDRYVNGKPYKDFNKDKTGKGYWWDSYIPDGREAEPGAFDCDKETFWVDKGDPPPADIPEAVTPEVLAKLAYAEIRVPGTKVTLAPKGNTTKVNLPTWAWLNKAEFKPVSVTASVPVLNIQATTTAEPISLKIDPGTKDAAIYPTSGVCPLNTKTDQIGEPYTKGKSHETPPCGVRYLRSSGDGTFPLKATVTWKIHWTGTGVNEEKPLPDGEFGADQNVVVQEVQAVNR